MFGRNFTSPIQTESLSIDWRTVGPFMANSYFAVCSKTREAVLIDACDQGEVLIQMIERWGGKIKYILQTHAHIDHVRALPELKEWSGAPIVLHPKERMMYDAIDMQCQLFGFPPFGPLPEPDLLLEDGAELEFGDGHQIKLFFSPGHTSGSLCYLIDGQFLFSGDVLFSGSIGRTDLPGGDFEQLISSINRLIDEIGDAIVLSGHGPPTTLETERRYNPFLT